VRRTVAILAVAVPAALLVPAAADAGAGRAASPPPPGPGGPVTVQADVTRKSSLVAPTTTSHRDKRLRVSDAATPPSPGTTPAVSASSPLPVAQDGVRHAARATSGARAPPALT
jgi:hypothetical protein